MRVFSVIDVPTARTLVPKIRGLSDQAGRLVGTASAYEGLLYSLVSVPVAHPEALTRLEGLKDVFETLVRSAPPADLNRVLRVQGRSLPGLLKEALVKRIKELHVN